MPARLALATAPPRTLTVPRTLESRPLWTRLQLDELWPRLAEAQVATLDVAYCLELRAPDLLQVIGPEPCPAHGLARCPSHGVDWL